MRATLPAALALLLAGCLEPPRRPDAGIPSCDPFDPSTCAADETCQFVSFSSFGCVPAGDAGDQAPCDESRCAHGLFCATPPDGAQSLCLGLCHEDGDCPQASGLQMCTLALYSGGPPALCQQLQPCEPLIMPVSCSPSQKCSLLRLPGPYVCMGPGTRGDYAPCEVESDCRGGFACVRYGDDEEQHCVGFCGTDDDCPQGAGLELCLRRNYPDRPPIFCERAQSCTPGGVACPAGQSCYPYLPSSTNLSSVVGLCRTTGGVFEGSPCQFLNDCRDGMACLEPSVGAPMTCRRVCSVDQSLPCPTGESCVAINPRFGACD